MEVKDIDNKIYFENFFKKDCEGRTLYSGDIFMSYEEYLQCKKNDMIINDDTVLYIIEYFTVIDKHNEEVIVPFILSSRYISYKISTLNQNYKIIKLSENDLNEFKFINSNNDIINFKNLIYYKNIKKIQRGSYFRNQWFNKYGKFAFINFRVNNEISNKNFELSIPYFTTCMIEEFYNKEIIDKPNRNFEIFCINPNNKNHIEYFFKFKRGN